jgi:DNA-directed RNA polymerase subunit RPC12/RpoP
MFVPADMIHNGIFLAIIGLPEMEANMVIMDEKYCYDCGAEFVPQRDENGNLVVNDQDQIYCGCPECGHRYTIAKINE